MSIFNDDIAEKSEDADGFSESTNNLSDKTMNSEDKIALKELITKLSKKIKYHQDRYYNGEPEISDDEFDALWDRLRRVDINNPIFSSVGVDNDAFFKKKEHYMPMGSLDKAANPEEFMTWIHNHPSEEYMVQYKLDGASLELQYEKGKLVAAVTRGNGKKGDDILINARNMQGVMKRLSQEISIAIRGEVIMTHKVLQTHFPDKANCRNAANGLMKRKDGKNVNYLQVMCYDLHFLHGENNSNITELQKIHLLQDLGFQVVSYEVFADPSDIIAYREGVIKKRSTLGYDIDGLVVKLPLSEKEDMESLKPDRQIAFKFPLEEAQTKIVDIEWSKSGHLYTPVAILEPVQLAGTVVKRASLVHLDHIKELGANIGAEVLVVKRGEIIPKINKVIIPSAREEIDMPLECDVCRSKVETTGTRTFCPNVLCRRRLLFRIERWCNMLEIDFLGESILHRLVMEENFINKLGDLYRLNREKLIELDRIGEGLADKLLASIASKTEVPFSTFLAGLGIDGVALLTAEKIENSGISTIEKLFQAKPEELSTIEDIGPIIAQNIVDTVQLLHDEIVDLSSAVHIVEASPMDIEKAILLGKSFCFTGNLEGIPRKDAQQHVKSLGGIVKSSVVRDLDFLVADDVNSTSSKSVQAQALGVVILNRDDFIRMTKYQL